METKLILIRHGESLGNATRTYLGHTDLDLSDKGREFDREHLRRLSTNDHQAVTGISQDEQRMLEALLLRMRDNLLEV